MITLVKQDLKNGKTYLSFSFRVGKEIRYEKDVVSADWLGANAIFSRYFSESICDFLLRYAWSREQCYRHVEALPADVYQAKQKHLMRIREAAFHARALRGISSVRAISQVFDDLEAVLPRKANYWNTAVAELIDWCNTQIELKKVTNPS